MRLPSVPTLPMVEHLNTTYFNKVWNAPDDHGRANFPLPKAANRLQTGSVPVNLSVVGLPTTDKVYAVYRVAVHAFGRFITFQSNVWTKDSDIQKSFGVTMTAFAASGRVIPAGQIYTYYDPLRSMVLVAIDRTFTSGCIGQSYPDLYMTVYFDTTRNTPITSKVFELSATITPAIVTQAIVTAKTTCPVGTIVYVNGWLYDPANVPTLFTGDIVDISCDPDIIGYCDLTIDDNRTGYYSELYKEYREVLHIPKVLNPNNFIITTDTLTAVIFDIPSKKGVYGHRVDKHAIESVSHNDFSMSRSVLQGFQNSLMSEGITVRLYVRLPTDPQRLENDVNHIIDLYTLPDAEIKDQLVALSSHQVAQWRASHLEQSAYIRLLYNFPGFASDFVIANYTEALGYYDVASKLSQAMHYYTYKGGEVEIRKPARLVGYPCQVLVYADGRKVPEDAIQVTNHSSRAFKLGFKAGSYVQVNSRMAVYVTESSLRTPQAFNPTLAAPSITLDNEDYTLVKIVPYTTPKPVWQANATKGYHAIPVSPADYTTKVNTNGTVTYTSSAIHYGESFYLIPCYGLTTAQYALDTIINGKDPIILPLEVRDGVGTILPLVAYRAMEVYINGYRLIEGVDYTCDPIIGDFDDVLQTLLVVSNAEYLNIGGVGNTLEVVVHGDKVVSDDKGYVISNLMNRDTPPMIWSKSCGRAFAKGLLVEKVHEVGDTLVCETPIADGTPYLLEWTIPYGVEKLMRGVSPNDDVSLRTLIFKVLNLTPPVYPNLVLVSDLYALYSPYLAQIVCDVSDGTFVITDEPKDDMFLKQFFAYKQLFPRDPVLEPNNPFLDRRFITLAAHYANLSVQDPRQMISMQRLIRLLLTPSDLSIHEVLI